MIKMVCDWLSVTYALQCNIVIIAIASSVISRAIINIISNLTKNILHLLVFSSQRNPANLCSKKSDKNQRAKKKHLQNVICCICLQVS